MKDTFKEESATLDGWTFDPSYFNEPSIPPDKEYSYVPEGRAIQFRIVNGDKEKFITLYNLHNGYYGKGFEFKVPVDPSKNKEDTL